ncbi:MAG: HAD family hydrolase [Lachnospiraceae bacterium]|nr:HAD family hydrolase [Lachnospiraceae bacterium]
MYKNYIFDLYGTLIDINTNEWNVSLWKKMAEFYGFYGAFYTPKELKEEFFKQCREREEKLKNKTGIDYPEIQIQKVFRKLFKLKGIKVDMQTCEVACKFFRIMSTKYIKLYDGVIEFLDDLKKQGKKIYLLSNAQQVFTEYEMKYLGILDKFDGVVFSSDERCRKPSAEFFNILIDRYEIKKEESIMIGNDATSDIFGAHNIGLASLYIHTSISPQDVKKEDVLADYIIMDGNFKKISKMILKKTKK